MKKLLLLVFVIAILTCIGNVACSSDEEHEHGKHKEQEHHEQEYVPPKSHIRSLGKHAHSRISPHIKKAEKTVADHLGRFSGATVEEFDITTEAFMNNRVVEHLLSIVFPEDLIILTSFFVGYMIFTTDILVSFRVELFISFLVYVLLLAYDSQMLSTGLLNYSIYSKDAHMKVICYLLEYFLIACLAYTVSCINGFYRYVIYLVYLAVRFITPRKIPYTKLVPGIPLILGTWVLIVITSIFRGDDVFKPLFLHLALSIPGLFFALLIAIIVAQRETISQYMSKKKVD